MVLEGSVGSVGQAGGIRRKHNLHCRMAFPERKPPLCLSDDSAQARRCEFDFINHKRLLYPIKTVWTLTSGLRIGYNKGYGCIFPQTFVHWMYGHFILTELWGNGHYIELRLKGKYKCLTDILALQGDTLKETWGQGKGCLFLTSLQVKLLL